MKMNRKESMQKRLWRLCVKDVLWQLVKKLESQ